MAPTRTEIGGALEGSGCDVVVSATGSSAAVGRQVCSSVCGKGVCCRMGSRLLDQVGGGGAESYPHAVGVVVAEVLADVAEEALESSNPPEVAK
eukprot:16442946-Heterocapsa_arctica.AAC.1